MSGRSQAGFFATADCCSFHRRASALVKLKGGSKSNAFAVQKVHKLAMDRAKEIARRLREEREAEQKV